MWPELRLLFRGQRDMICMKNVIFERGTTNVQYFMQNKSETGREVLHCIAILGGTLFYAAGMNLFVVPAGLYTGGIMGLAQLLRTLLIHLTGWTPKIDIAGLLNYAINLPVLLIAWRRLDHTVVLKTLLAVTGITVFLMIIPRTDILSGDQLARCLIGGILCGGSIGIILWMGGTSGGMDVIGMMLIKSGSHTSIGHVNLAWNLMLYTVCAVAFNLSTAIYSILFSFISTTTMDKLHMQNINVEVTVVTKLLSPEMEQEILVDLHRGITRYEGIGEYTGQPVHIFYILVSKYEIGHLRSIVLKYDPHAFIVAKDGAVVYGNYKKKI